MSMLRTLLIVANAGVVIWLGWLLIVDFPDSDSLVLAGLILLFILNIYFIVFLKKANDWIDWISLFLKRKALEEKKRISDLEN